MLADAADDVAAVANLLERRGTRPRAPPSLSATMAQARTGSRQYSVQGDGATSSSSFWQRRGCVLEWSRSRPAARHGPELISAHFPCQGAEVKALTALQTCATRAHLRLLGEARAMTKSDDEARARSARRQRSCTRGAVPKPSTASSIRRFIGDRPFFIRPSTTSSRASSPIPTAGARRRRRVRLKRSSPNSPAAQRRYSPQPDFAPSRPRFSHSSRPAITF